MILNSITILKLRNIQGDLILLCLLKYIIGKYAEFKENSTNGRTKPKYLMLPVQNNLNKLYLGTLNK